MSKKEDKEITEHISLNEAVGFLKAKEDNPKLTLSKYRKDIFLKYFFIVDEARFYPTNGQVGLGGLLGRFIELRRKVKDGGSKKS